MRFQSNVADISFCISAVWVLIPETPTHYSTSLLLPTLRHVFLTDCFLLWSFLATCKSRVLRHVFITCFSSTHVELPVIRTLVCSIVNQ